MKVSTKPGAQPSSYSVGKCYTLQHWGIVYLRTLWKLLSSSLILWVWAKYNF